MSVHSCRGNQIRGRRQRAPEALPLGRRVSRKDASSGGEADLPRAEPEGHSLQLP